MWGDRGPIGVPVRLRDLPEPQHDPAQVREAADEILARRRYDWDDPSENPVDAAAEWIADRLADLAGSAGLNVTIPTWVGWGVLVLLVVLVAYVLLRSRGGVRVDRPARPADDVVVDRGDELVDWAAEADRAEAAGHWREGLRCRYRALAGELARRDVIADLVGRTAGEYVAEVAAACPAASPAFGAATELFERAWYGGEATGPAERDRFAALAAEVLAAAPGPVGGRRARPGRRELAVPT